MQNLENFATELEAEETKEGQSQSTATLEKLEEEAEDFTEARKARKPSQMTNT